MEYKLVSDDGRCRGEVKRTFSGAYRAYYYATKRTTNKLFRSRVSDPERDAKQWIHDQITLYDDYVAKRGEFKDPASPNPPKPATREELKQVLQDLVVAVRRDRSWHPFCRVGRLLQDAEDLLKRGENV